MLEVFCKYCGRRMIVYASSERLKHYDVKNVVCMCCYIRNGGVVYDFRRGVEIRE